MEASARDWQWSSYRGTAGLAAVPTWLEINWLLAALGSQRNNKRQDKTPTFNDRPYGFARITACDNQRHDYSASNST
jgi:hypothetical protein